MLWGSDACRMALPSHVLASENEKWLVPGHQTTKGLLVKDLKGHGPAIDQPLRDLLGQFFFLDLNPVLGTRCQPVGPPSSPAWILLKEARLTAESLNKLVVTQLRAMASRADSVLLFNRRFIL